MRKFLAEKPYLNCPHCGSTEISLFDRVITRHEFVRTNCGRKYWIPQKVDNMRKGILFCGLIPFFGLGTPQAIEFAIVYGILYFLSPFLVGVVCAYIYPLEKVSDDY